MGIQSLFQARFTAALMSVVCLSALFTGACEDSSDTKPQEGVDNSGSSGSSDSSGSGPGAPKPVATGSSDGRLVTVDGTTYEVHTFLYNADTATPEGQTAYTLSFPDGFEGVVSNAIIVAGGGGGGGISANNVDGSGGGGGGGVITAEDYQIGASGAAILVGTGGTGGVKSTRGNTGKDSALDNGSEPLTAKGGGGGGAGDGSISGLEGGSSGGGGAGNGQGGTSPVPYEHQADGRGSQGYQGGKAAGVNKILDCGGGGGGAGSKGGAGSGNTGGQPGAGGDPRDLENIPYHGDLSVSPGGRGGAILAQALTTEDVAAVPSEYGGGGDGGSGSTVTGGVAEAGTGAAGKEGIVIVWWEYVSVP